MTFWTYDVANQMATAASGGQLTTYGYSPNGKLTTVNEQSGLITMVYDVENRLTVHVAGTAIVSFAYGGDGLKRLEKVGSGANDVNLGRK